MALSLTDQARAKVVRAILGFHDVSGSELATIIGCSQSSASRKLAGERGFTPDELQFIAEHFGIDPRLLLRPDPLLDLLDGEPACVTEAEPAAPAEAESAPAAA